MKRRTWLIANVNAQVKSQLAFQKFEKEFINGNQNQRRSGPKGGQAVDAQGNVPAEQPAVQQPQYGG